MNSRGWKIVLVVSFVLNIFLVGGVAGGAYQWFSAQHAREAAAAPRVALRFAADGLSPERQQQFKAALREARRDARVYARAGRDARRDVLALMDAPKLDRAALDAALARAREADANLRVHVERSLVDFVAKLSPEERVIFVEGLRHRGQWRQPAAQKPPAQ
jgi:uncharacterized membrane protein